MTLGFMVVEGSEEVIVNGQNLIRNQDYIIDYFSGSITFTDSELGRMAVDPASSVNVTYEENQLVSFDQKLMAGTRMEMDLGENNFIGFTALYYNQTIMDDKVNITGIVKGSGMIKPNMATTVSYTHLTLPTSDLV